MNSPADFLFVARALDVIVIGTLTFSLFLSFLRLARGPSRPDRVVALDLISMLAVGYTAVYAVFSGQAILLDAAIVVTLVNFLATVGFARYVEKGTMGMQGAQEGDRR
jgi:multicomponent Na+:H+ antiporter subunit F